MIYKVLYIPGGAGFLPSTVQLPENYPSLKLTANIAPENGWLEDDFPFGGKRPIFRGKLAVSLGEGT